MYECNSCFTVFETPRTKVLPRRRRLGNPDLDHEDDFIQECPECGQAENFKVIDDE